MYDINYNIPLWLSIVFIIGGLVTLSWSADRFVDASARLARAFGVSPMIVGMVIIGFGTSAPELAVSVLSALGNKADLSLGNAYGSCIFNLAGILGVSAIIWPLKVRPSVVFVSVPLLLFICVVSFFLVVDNDFQWWNGAILALMFCIIMPWYCWYDQKRNGKKLETPEEKFEAALERPAVRLSDLFWVVVGITLLVGSSHVLVWGCVDLARDVFRISTLMIGLTVVAVGTSLPELASAIASARRREHELVIGNIVGSNLFNMLAVVGISGWIAPYAGFSKYIIKRDLPVIMLMTLALVLFGINWRHPGRNGRVYRNEGVLWVIALVVYVVIMIAQETKFW